MVKKGKFAFIQTLFWGLWPSHPCMALCTIIEANLLQLCRRLHTSSNRSLQFENEIAQVLPCDSTIEAIREFNCDHRLWYKIGDIGSDLGNLFGTWWSAFRA